MKIYAILVLEFYNNLVLKNTTLYLPILIGIILIPLSWSYVNVILNTGKN